MGLAAQILCVAIVAWAVSPAGASARAPKSAAPAPEAGAEPASPEAAVVDDRSPEVDPSLVGAAEAASSADPAHLDDEATEAAPSTADVVLSIPPVQTVVSLFSRGVTVNDDAEEPPAIPVRVRVHSKRAGASLSLTVAF